jgi:competence protein ComEC
LFIGKIVLIFLLGVLWLLFRVSIIPFSISNEYLGKPIEVTGTVISIPTHTPLQVKFEYLIESINTQPCQPVRAILSEYNYGKLPSKSMKIGERWKFTVRLKKPRGFWNPGSFDYEIWLLQRSITVTGTIIRSTRSELLAKGLTSQYTPWMLRYSLLNQIFKVRACLSKRIRLAIEDTTHIGLLNALVIGEREEISDAHWAIMRATGTNHLFAISGLHVGFVGGFAYGIVALIWRRLGGWCLYIPMQQAAYFSAWLVALIYGVISGFALPVQRALIMLTVFITALLQRRVLPTWKGWCLALILVLAWNPFTVLSESFWLSFGAVAIIFYGLGERLPVLSKNNTPYWKRLWDKWGYTQWVISLGLIPMTVWFFNQVPLLGFFANLIAIPWTGFLVLPISLIGALIFPLWPQLATLCIKLGYQALLLLWKFLAYVAANPLSVVWMNIPTAWILISVSISVLLLISPYGFPTRYYLACISLLPLLLSKTPGPQHGEIWLTLLDVGQGLAVVVRTHTHVLLYDTGPCFGKNWDAGNSIIVPYLNQLGIRNIDKLIVSHGDMDHSGGAASIVQSLCVRSMISSEPERLSVKKVARCSQGQMWVWNGVKFTILHPPSSNEFKSNDRSCVLQIDNGTHRILLPGDIHRKGEKSLLQNYPEIGQVSVLVAPHHGSRTSSSEAFVKATRPKFVLFATGYRNRFKFPHTKIMQRYKQYGSQLYSTAQEGAITIKLGISEPVIKLESYSRIHPRFWRKIPLSENIT